MTDTNKSKQNVPERRGNPIEPTTALGAFIRNRRTELGLTQQALTKHANINYATISQLETGVAKRCSVKTLKALTQVLQCDKKELEALYPADPRRVRTLNSLEEFIKTRCVELEISFAEIARRADLSLASLEGYGRVGFLPTKYIILFTQVLQCKENDLEKFIRPKHPKKSGNIPDSPLGKFLQKTREEKGLTLEYVGEAIGVTRERVRQMEANGKSSALRLERLAKLYEVELGDLIAMKTKTARKMTQRYTHTISSPLVKWLAEQRVAKGISQTVLSARMGYASVSSITQFENEKVRSTRSLVGEVANALEVEIPEELLAHVCVAKKKNSPAPRTQKAPFDPLKPLTIPLYERDMPLAQRIILFRQVNYLTQMELAKLVEVWPAQISLAESGKSKPYAKLIAKIEKIIGTWPQNVKPPRTLKIPWYTLLDEVRKRQALGWRIEAVNPAGERHVIDISLS